MGEGASGRTGGGSSAKAIRAERGGKESGGAAEVSFGEVNRIRSLGRCSKRLILSSEGRGNERIWLEARSDSGGKGLGGVRVARISVPPSMGKEGSVLENGRDKISAWGFAPFTLFWDSEAEEV